MTLTAPLMLTDAIPSSFLYPRLFWLAIPAILLLLWLTRHSFVRDNPRYDDERSIRRRAKLRTTIFWTRTLIVLLLIAVLATPLTRQTLLRPGDDRISSMCLTLT